MFNRCTLSLALTATLLTALPLDAQQVQTYQPTLASLDRHPLPDWYADAKLGIFIHWGLYSVPGWAPPKALPSTATTEEQIASDGYAEWYYNTMRIPDSPTSRYHHEHYNDANYYDFTAAFNRETRKWSPDKMAATFRMAGARYVVLTSKHHEGFTLWPSKVVNPNQKNLNADRDIVGELTTSIRSAGLKMGLYYSGGYDWTFNRGPIETSKDFDTVKPESSAYGQYADAQAEELIARYHPSVLWNDIDWPKSGNALKVMADYYNAVPDGVVDDRFGVPHSDFTSPEYSKLDTIQTKKWEECRGLGRSFGYNRAEGEAETIAPADLIALLVDIVSKNGNLLLDVGPEADGTIPAVQMDRLVKLGAWLKQNGDAIYGTRPWTRAEGKTADGMSLRFATKGTKLYAILLGKPDASSVLLKDVSAKSGTTIHLLGVTAPLTWKPEGNDLNITLPTTMPGNYAWALEIKSPS
jgi:alpha-L-fucosidase